ncbi:hypothetical protein [Salinibacter sp. 10B]|uniref:hypothetical protein n=1 Tax=Salinibacter sp. 10B TaxID=1923971 RepID=UPI0015E286CB|nr:hypothetical protein [Salinibacter sp. 10B]
MSDAPQNVKITGIRIPFLDLVWLLTKVALASIPAALLVGLIYAMIYALLTGSIAGIG